MTRTAQHRPAALTIGSLFTGYGGLDLAVESVLDARTVWVSEIDPAASRILAKRFPDAPNLGDLTAIDWDTVPRVDVITGGSPCQDLSTAGRRAGMTDGTRSNLWVAMRDAIAALQPTYVVWENVRGALSATAASSLEPCPGCMGGTGHARPSLRALGRVLGDLADLGYDAQWYGLRAADVGACHGRFRVFVLAYARGIGGHQGIEHDGRGAQVADGSGVPHERDRHALRAGPDRALTLLPTPTSNLGDNGGPQDPAKRRAGGHSVSIEDAVYGLALLPTPTTERREVQLLPTPTARDYKGRNQRGDATCLQGALDMLPTPRASDGTNGGPNQRGSSGDLMLPSAVQPSRWGHYAPAIHSHEQLVGRAAPAPTEIGPSGKARLSARAVEWMMGLPAGWVTGCGLTRTEELKALGNGVVPQQAAAALHVMRRAAGW